MELDKSNAYTLVDTLTKEGTAPKSLGGLLVNFKANILRKSSAPSAERERSWRGDYLAS